ncbi:MAG TPA: GGDEF domain-containing protein [Magnetospirillaceae bacterium]|jgi:diguanylate cyclase (GGDEF)-like protein
MNTNVISPDTGERLLDMIKDGAMVLDRAGTIIWANRAIRDLLGATDALRGCRLGDLLMASVPTETLLADRSAPSGRSKWLVATAIRSGTELLVSTQYRPQTEEFTVVARPFTSAVSNFDRVISFATRDDVTQLMNRDAFEERLSAAIERNEAGCVICADVDQFSTINEVYGHAEGDALLRAVAHRTRSSMGVDLQVARLYGGRFAAFIAADSDEAAQRLAGETSERLHHVMLPLFSICGGVQPISFSIGVARWRVDGVSADDLLAAAETAVHSVRAGSDKTRWFESAMLAERRRFFETEAELRLAIEQNALTLHYQPKVSAADLSIVGFEALVRWNHPTKGMISPGFFVPVAEQSNLIIDLGRWVLREACRQQAEWRAQGLKLVPVAVNVSPQQLLSQPISVLLAPLTEYGIDLDLLEIEITESAMMDRLPMATKVIESLRQSGLHISIDDFGTGHSSLGNLRRLPIDVLKIDRSFVEDIDRSQEAYDIVATIVAMAKTMSLNLVAEGVETIEQAKLLQAHGVDVMQGYLFHKPMPGDAAGRLLGSATGQADTF